VILELVNGRRVTAAGTEPNHRLRAAASGLIEALDGPADPGGEVYTLTLPPSALVYPGLINAHDHLIGTFQPRVGFGPYLNWFQWDNDLKRSAVFRQRNMIDAASVYQLGGLKSILSGVTTVADHIPRKISAPHIAALPVRVVAPYCLAHSVASFRLHWGDGPEVEYARASQRDLPFMVHVGEGYDPETRGELQELDRLRALGSNTLLVHGVSFTASDAALASRRGASLAWCPGSNMFMFGRTTDIRQLRQAGVNVCLGTDSLFTGTSGLLEEMRLARTCYNECYGEELPARDLFEMVTVNAARALRIEHQAGSIARGRRADILCLAPQGEDCDPHAALLETRAADIHLLLCGGRPLLGLPEHLPLFRAAARPFRRIRLGRAGGRGPVERLVAGDPPGLLDRIRARLGFRKELPFMLAPEPGGGGEA
jgi:cytosine/adenosine deaminase-related metal-dependent hydrolase